jgi:hypothetical protein
MFIKKVFVVKQSQSRDRHSNGPRPDTRTKKVNLKGSVEFDRMALMGWGGLYGLFPRRPRPLCKVAYCLPSSRTSLLTLNPNTTRSPQAPIIATERAAGG